jgi:carboxypeptidase family protein
MLNKVMVVLLCVTAQYTLHNRFDSGKYKGFTKAADEYAIAEMKHPLTVSGIQGTITSEVHGEALKGTLFEIRGPGELETIRSAKTDQRGRFKIRNVPAGTYMFKTTLDGYCSRVGTIIVSKDASQKGIDLVLGLSI